MTTTARSITATTTIFLLMAARIHAASIPGRQFFGDGSGSDGSIDSIMASLTKGINFGDPFSSALGGGGGVFDSLTAVDTPATATGTSTGTGTGTRTSTDAAGQYVTKVSIVGGSEVTLGPQSGGLATTLGSLTFTVAAPVSTTTTASVSGSASGSAANNFVSGSVSTASGSTMSGSSMSVSGSGSTSASSGSSTSTGTSSSTTSSASSSTSTSTSASSSSTSNASSSTSASSSSSSSSPSNAATSRSQSVDLRLFSAGIATVLGGILLGASIA